MIKDLFSIAKFLISELGFKIRDLISDVRYELKKRG